MSSTRNELRPVLVNEIDVAPANKWLKVCPPLLLGLPAVVNMMDSRLVRPANDFTVKTAELPSSWNQNELTENTPPDANVMIEV